MNQDEEHLKLLTIFHYVVAGLAALFALFPVLHLAMGLAMILSPESWGDGKGQGPPPFFGWFFVIFAGVFILAGLLLASGIFIAGRCLAKRRRHTFCLVMGGVECIFMPLGTVLGVFTIMVLSRPSVKALFSDARGESPA
jgi:hypothetical protein